MKKNDLLCYAKDFEKADYVEIYVETNPNGNLYPHTDTVRYISDDIDIIPEIDLTKIYIDLMSKDDYENTILANSSVSFTEMFDEDDKIFVIVLPYGTIQD